MPLPPSRRDTIGPPPRDVSDLAAQTRHLTSYARSLDPGILGGRFRTPTPVPKGPPRQLVGGDAAGDDTDYAWEFDDRYTVTALGTQTPRLSHVPIDETLHVFWHPGGRGGLRLTSEFFAVDDQVVTIGDPGFLAVGDQFSFQYEYEVSDDVLDFEFIAVVGGIYHTEDETLRFTPPPEMEPGDFLLIAARGAGAPGGGDITRGVSSGDSRVSLIYAATHPVIEGVLTGFATSSRAPLSVNFVRDPGFVSGGASGIMLVARGVNNVSSMSAVEAGGVTPQAAGVGAVAVTWDGNSSFAFTHSDPPTGYTEGANTGFNYTSTDVSYWFDAAAEISPAGSYFGEGCLIVGLA